MMMMKMMMMIYDDDDVVDSLLWVKMVTMTQIENTFQQNTFLLSQPEDVSHIYLPGLHERQQKRKLKKNNCTKRSTEVRSVMFRISMRCKECQLKNDYFQGTDARRSGSEEDKIRRKRSKKRRGGCSDKEGPIEATSLARSLLERIIEDITHDADPVGGVVDFQAKSTPLVEESFSGSEISSNDEGPRLERNSPVAWTEPKIGRKILTTSLMLKRKKNINRRHKHTVPRLKGGGGDDETISDEDNGDEMGSEENKRKPNEASTTDGEDPSCESSWESLSALERQGSWVDWERNRRSLRPLPLESPRRPDLAYLNTTVDEAADEDGIDHYDLAKDPYRRIDGQVEVVRQAHRDQRKVAGGIYQCRDDGKEDYYLHIMKGGGKFLGIKLMHYEPPQKPIVQFETFAEMGYERYVQCSSQRVRLNLPQETDTGFKWYGHGGNTYLFSSSVYKFCERVDNDFHFSAPGCERITQAPGASQLLCSNKSCGVIYWHLSVIFFHRLKPKHFKEVGQEHFALMLLKSKEHVLLWTDKAGNQTHWTRLEHSSPCEKFHVFEGSLKRIRYVAGEGLLPQSNFSLPAYSPILCTWDDVQPFKRLPSTCNW